jgi:hypothetical protein
VQTSADRKAPILVIRKTGPHEITADRLISRILSRTAIPLGGALLRRSRHFQDRVSACNQLCRSQPIRLRKHVPGNALSDLPGTSARRAGTRRHCCRTRSLFGLAPCGVYPASVVTAGAVRSYRTFSPLPWLPAKRGRFVFCGTGRPGALTLRSRMLSGTLPCGVRTFLRRFACAPRQRPPSLPALRSYPNRTPSSLNANPAAAQ